MAGIKSSPTCVGASVIISFLVIFFGVWAGEEAFHKNQPGTHKSAETISPCDQGLPDYLQSKRRSLVSRLLARVGLSRRLDEECTKEKTLLRQKPFIMSHDAATGYASGTTPAHKTQDMDFTGQLNCGARALDLRLGYYTEPDRLAKHLKFHHDVYMDDQSVKSEIGGEVLTWAAKNPDELVILMLSHCKNGPSGERGGGKDGGDCSQDFFEPFETLNIHVVKGEKLLDLKTMTVAQAEALAQHKDRPGKVLAIHATDEAVNPNNDYKVALTRSVQDKITQGIANGNIKENIGGIAKSLLPFGLGKENGGYPAPYYASSCLPNEFSDKCKSCMCIEGGENNAYQQNACVLDAIPNGSGDNGCVKKDFVSQDPSWMALWSYCKDKLKDSYDKPWQLQAIWQAPLAPFKSTVATGINTQIMLRLLNPEWSGEWTRAYPDSSFNKVNFLLLNAVQCEGPLIGERFGAKSKDVCPHKCEIPAWMKAIPY